MIPSFTMFRMAVQLGTGSRALFAAQEMQHAGGYGEESHYSATEKQAELYGILLYIDISEHAEKFSGLSGRIRV